MHSPACSEEFYWTAYLAIMRRPFPLTKYAYKTLHDSVYHDCRALQMRQRHRLQSIIESDIEPAYIISAERYYGTMWPTTIIIIIMSRCVAGISLIEKPSFTSVCCSLLWDSPGGSIVSSDRAAQQASQSVMMVPLYHWLLIISVMTWGYSRLSWQCHLWAQSRLV